MKPNIYSAEQKLCRTCGRRISPNSTLDVCGYHTPKRKCRIYICDQQAKIHGFCVKHYEANLTQGAE